MKAMSEATVDYAIMDCEKCGVREEPHEVDSLSCLKRQVDNEISDMMMVAGEVSVVYDTLTNSRLSKPNTMAQHVIDAVQEAQKQHEEEVIKEALEPIEVELESAEADANRLAEALNALLPDGPHYDLSYHGGSACGACGNSVSSSPNGHKPDCAWLAARTAFDKHRERAE